MSTKDASKNAPPEQVSSSEKDRLLARRKLLSSATYLPPLVLATFVADKALAQASCGPASCNPCCNPMDTGCGPRPNCN
jgi:hypothetical protein